MPPFLHHLLRNLITIAPLLAWLLGYRWLQTSGLLADQINLLVFGAISFVVLLLIMWFMGARLRAQRHAWPFGPFRLQEFVADVLSLLLLYALVQWVV